MTKITIDLTNDELKVLKSRGKKNFLTIKEQIEDIIRRSIISYKKSKSSILSGDTDDKLINIFSRSRRGRKKKKS